MTTPTTGTTPAPNFDRLYSGDPDPWQVATSWYEQRKISTVLASLRRPTYRLAWDAGCGTGELTAALTARARQIVATDASHEAVSLSRTRLSSADIGADTGAVRVELSALPARPECLVEAPDLVIVSEVLYYLSPDDRQAAYALIDDVAAKDADLVLVHWGPQADDADVSGLAAFNEATEELNARGWGRLVTHIDPEFVLGLFSADIPEHVGGRDGDPSHNEADHR